MFLQNSKHTFNSLDCFHQIFLASDVPSTFSVFLVIVSKVIIGRPINGFHCINSLDHIHNRFRIFSNNHKIINMLTNVIIAISIFVELNPNILVVLSQSESNSTKRSRKVQVPMFRGGSQSIYSAFLIILKKTIPMSHQTLCLPLHRPSHW